MHLREGVKSLIVFYASSFWIEETAKPEKESKKGNGDIEETNWGISGQK